MTKPALLLHLLPILISVGLVVAVAEWSAQSRAAESGPTLPGLQAPLRSVTAYLSAPARPPRAQSAITLGLRN